MSVVQLASENSEVAIAEILIPAASEAQAKTNADYKREIKEFCDRVKVEQGRKSIKWNTALVRELFAIRCWTIPEGWEFPGNANEKIPFTCDKGHEHEINLYLFKSGRGCGKCVGYFTKEEREKEIRTAFKKAGRIIPDDWEFTGVKDNIPYWCEKGQHSHQQSWDSFKNGGRSCGKCFGYISKEEWEIKIRTGFKGAGRIIPPEWEYVSTTEPIPYWCEIGQHYHEQTWHCFDQGYGCGRCAGYFSKEEREKEIRAAFKKAGRIIPPEWEYVSTTEPIPYWCEIGQHYHQQVWNSFKNGDGCGKCSGRLPKDEWNIKIRGAFKKAGRIIPEDWVFSDIHTPIPYWCEIGKHDHQQSWLSFREGRGCGKCTALNRPLLTKILSFKEAVRWAISRTDYSLSTDVRLNYFDRVNQEINNSYVKELADILNSRQNFEDTDHKVCIVFFNLNNLEELLAANDPINLRNIPRWANRHRSDNLTLSEIVLLFSDRRLREIYNLASKYALKRKKGLPEKLPLEQKEFDAWCETVSFSKKDKSRFHNWYDLF